MVRILNKTYPQHLGILVKFSRTWTTSCQFWNTLMKSIVDEHTYQYNAGKGPRRSIHDNKMEKCHASEMES